ncbi:hypothetical protein CARUB_v10019155mg [Capsella rubella]|uniref:Uncharacterized protein n=1 Tax=Capsella rubella TaxID=81985 RepID=R0HP89_9BRAS|nr:S-protein homolog 2 [Capsella rubella]EOA25788.1 hypothetical protein CARUB_v10019155mg [Capsella rubella]
MGGHRNMITLIVILSSLLNVALSQNGVVVGKDIYKWNLFPTIKVFVRNDLRGLVLYSACYSGGWQKNLYHADFLPGMTRKIFEFRKDLFFWGENIRYCVFKFGGQIRRFTIYRDRRDNIIGYQCRNCYWSVRRNGLCALDSQTGKYDLCYSWNK